MSELLTMYPAQPNSPITTLAGALSVGQTSFAVADASVLPAPPNLLVIGGDTTYAETVLMTAKNTTANMVTVNRALEGVQFSWPAGTIIGRFFTARELNVIINNITTLNQSKVEKLPASRAGNFAILDIDGNVYDSGTHPEFFSMNGHHHDERYHPIVTNVASGNLPIVSGQGYLEDSGFSTDDFARYSHTHAYIATTKMNAANGVAGLNSVKKVKPEQASSTMEILSEPRAFTTSDAGQMLLCDFSVNGTMLIPSDSSASIPVGTEIELVQYGEGSVSIKPDGVHSEIEGDQISNTRTSNSKYTLMTASSYTYNYETEQFELVDPEETTNANAVAGLYIVSLAAGTDESTAGPIVYHIDEKSSNYVYLLTPITHVFDPATTLHAPNGTKLSSRYSTAAIKKLGASEWLLAGDCS